MKRTYPESVKPFKAVYSVEEDAIVSHNGARFFNRPLYAPNIPAMALAGDKPQMRLIDAEYCYGALLLGYVRGESGKWLHEFDTITTRFYPSRVVWEISDSSLVGVSILCEGLAQAEGNGMTLKLTVQGQQAGDKIIWAFGGGAPKTPDQKNMPSNIWVYDPSFHPGQTEKGLTQELCSLGNLVRVSGEAFVVTPPLSGGYPSHEHYADVLGNSEIGHPRGQSAFGSCSVASNPNIGDASALGSPLALIRSVAGKSPLVCGQFLAGEAGGAVYLAIHADATSRTESFLSSGKGLSNLAAVHEQAVRRASDFANRIVTHTPDPALDAAVGFEAAAVDATWYPPYYTHGAMVWNCRFLGWRRLYAPTAFGWHENVKTEMKYFLKSQVLESPNTKFRADPDFKLTMQAPDSRFFGKGRITMGNDFCYNAQSLWFDGLIHAWRWTGDTGLEDLLRPALELHLDWQRDCFDPDGNGLYESYVNTWATDQAWYNGGEGTQETAFAYRGYLAAADMAHRAGDIYKERSRLERAGLIRRSMKTLWMKAEGYPAEFREALGYRRLHPDPCLMTIFHPIDSELFDPMEAVQALNYTEWGLQRDISPLGGERCWTSNWVPWTWSLREMYPGENYQLALAYYQTGLAADGWKLLLGNYREGFYNSVVPGAVSHKSCGTDFADATTMFCRLIVEGLFGYVPDRPKGVVFFRPQFPPDWDHASIRTPDFEFKYQREKESLTWSISMIKSARMEFRVPVSARSVRTVTVNGRPAEWRAEAGFGQSVIVVQSPLGSAAEVRVEWDGAIPFEPSRHITAAVGQAVELRVPQGDIIEVIDPTGLMYDMRIEGALVRATVMHAGNKLVMVRVKTGDLEQWHTFKIAVRDTYAESQRSAKTLAAPPADAAWTPVILDGALNADVREVFKQQYLTPRVQTCSAQLGSDGYSTWAGTVWKVGVCTIDLSALPGLLGANGLLQTPKGVPFKWPGEGKNIAFTTQYDNFPNAIRVPVGLKGRAAWFLVAGTTNPFQTKIANAVLRLRYADGVEEALELVPPRNYWTLSDQYYYTRAEDSLLLNPPPPQVQLGKNCRAMVLNHVMRSGIVLESVELETLSQEVVVGLMGLTIMN